MTYKKTGWYTFIAPIQVGAVVTGASATEQRDLRRFGRYMGVAFQIRDDILNLVGDERPYGKETAGDLWEGKRTLMLLHAMRRATPVERAAAERILGKQRRDKTSADIDVLLALIERYDGVDRARAIGEQLADRARQVLDKPPDSCRRRSTGTSCRPCPTMSSPEKNEQLSEATEMSDDDVTTARTFGAGSGDPHRQSADRVNELLRRLSDRQLGLAAVGQELFTFARESARGYLDGLKAVGDDHRQALRDLNNSYGDRLLDRLLSGRGPGGQVPAAAGYRAEIALTGPVAARRERRVRGRQLQLRLEEITFLVSEFVDMAGQGPLRPLLKHRSAAAGRFYLRAKPR